MPWDVDYTFKPINFHSESSSESGKENTLNEIFDDLLSVQRVKKLFGKTIQKQLGIYKEEDNKKDEKKNEKKARALNRSTTLIRKMVGGKTIVNIEETPIEEVKQRLLNEKKNEVNKCEFCNQNDEKKTLSKM